MFTTSKASANKNLKILICALTALVPLASSFSPEYSEAKSHHADTQPHHVANPIQIGVKTITHGLKTPIDYQFNPFNKMWEGTQAGKPPVISSFSQDLSTKFDFFVEEQSNFAHLVINNKFHFDPVCILNFCAVQKEFPAINQLSNRLYSLSRVGNYSQETRFYDQLNHTVTAEHTFVSQPLLAELPNGIGIAAYMREKKDGHEFNVWNSTTNNLANSTYKFNANSKVELIRNDPDKLLFLITEPEPKNQRYNTIIFDPNSKKVFNTTVAGSWNSSTPLTYRFTGSGSLIFWGINPENKFQVVTVDQNYSVKIDTYKIDPHNNEPKYSFENGSLQIISAGKSKAYN